MPVALRPTLPTYVIRNWDELYETHETRKLVRLSWVPTPNKHDGNGYRRLMSQTDPGNLFAAFRLAVEIASKCPRRGVMADDHGPLTPRDMEYKTGLKAKHFARMLKVCVLPQFKIGWIDTTETAENLPARRETPGDCRENLPDEGKGREGNRREVKQRILLGGEKGLTSEPSAPECLKGLDLYENDQRLLKQWPELIKAWTAAYPGVDIIAQVKAAHAWEVSNPKKRKVDRGKFLRNWLSREQDSRGGRDDGKPRERSGRDFEGARKDAGKYAGIGTVVNLDEK